MSQKTFLGRPVINCDEDGKFFLYDLLTMIDNSFGQAHFMRTDQTCAYHFRALRKRIEELCSVGDCEFWVTVGLGEEISDGCAAVPQDDARAERLACCQACAAANALHKATPQASASEAEGVKPCKAEPRARTPCGTA